MKKNINEISGKMLSQKEMRDLKGGTANCGGTCKKTIASKGGGYIQVTGNCRLDATGSGCKCVTAEQTYEGC